jgi:hypothetical protein
MPSPDLQRLVLRNLLTSIRSAVGTELFRHLYVRDKQTGREFDALDDGDNACAYVVSGILVLHGLIDRAHATVATTLKAMTDSGWYKVTEPLPGAIAYWPDDHDAHIGFYVGEGVYMSNSSKERVPILHDKTLYDGREPEAYFIHPELLP